MKRIEGALLVAILLTVGGFAGAASFTHVKDWTMANSPAGTGEWFGWANAVISELIPMAALLVIRQRRRTGGSVGYPMFLLVCAAGLYLSAQLAVAKPGPSGWLLSAVPALAFLGLSKLVLAGAPESPAAASAPTVPFIAPATPAANVSMAQQLPQIEETPEQKGGEVPTRPRPGLVPVPATAFPTRPREAAL